MGTPEFGADILAELLKEHEITLVVTQPDRPPFNKKVYSFSPVKELAIQNGIEVFQPENIRSEVNTIKAVPCDLIVTAAYGQFIPLEILDFPPYRSINVHASLLPKYRGGAPIQRALMAGEEETGISIMYMEKKMDSGAILSQRALPISDDDNSSSLFGKLAKLGSEMILEVIHDLAQGNINPLPQDPRCVTYANVIKKTDEFLDFTNSALHLNRQIRALAFNPGAYFTIDEEVYKVYDSLVNKEEKQSLPGTIIKVTKNSFTIACGDYSSLSFNHIKPQGRSLMAVRDFLNGKGKNIIFENRRIQ